MPDAAADWYDTCWVAAQKAIDATDMRRQRSFNTPGDLYLWVHYKLRELKTYDRRPIGWMLRNAEQASASRANTAKSPRDAGLLCRPRRVPAQRSR